MYVCGAKPGIVLNDQVSLAWQHFRIRVCILSALIFD